LQTAPSSRGQHIRQPGAARILENVSDAVAVVDPEWTIVYLNRAAASLARRPKEQILGRTLWDVFPELIPTGAHTHLQHAMRAGEEVRFDHFHESSRRWYDVRAEPAGGALILFARDVTDLKCYQRLFETTEEGILIVDAEGRYVEVNESYCRILKTPRERLIGAHFSQFIPPDRIGEAQSAFERLRRGEMTPVDFPLRAADGTIVELAWTSTSNYLPGLYFCCCRDISERKRAEHERALLLERAQDAVEHAQWVQNELKRSNEDLRRANRDLETFAYSASHDLQEPLRNVAIFAQLLERRMGAKLEAEERGFLEGVLQGTQRMENLVQDLLAYSRATRPAEGLIPTIPAGDALARVMDRMKTRIEESGARITSAGLPEISIHPVHLEQLFHNLLSNAMKYRDRQQNTPPRIHVSAAQREGWWVISVADNGIGIDPKYATQIFGLFKRLHSRSEYPGSGVGLAICQRIIEQYGGRIWLESSILDEGSMFSFAIPDRRIE